MKNLYLSFIFIFLSFNFCSDNQNSELNISAKYIGKWRWEKTTGGIAAITTKPNENTILIRQYNFNNTFQIFLNDTLKVKTKYNIEEGEYGYDIKITYADIENYSYHFDQEIEYAQIKSNILEIWDGAFDGSFSWYTKEYDYFSFSSRMLPECYITAI